MKSNLHRKIITDKNGHRKTVWVKSNKDKPKDDVDQFISEQDLSIKKVSVDKIKPIIDFSSEQNKIYNYKSFESGLGTIIVDKKTKHIIDGNHRWKYAKDKGIKQINAVIIDSIPMHINKKVITKLSNKLKNEESKPKDKNKEFNDWFKGSKVVTKDGKPLIVYHGSHEEITEYYDGMYFTDDYYNADGYAGGEYVYEGYISLKKPLIIDAKGKKWDKIDTPYGTSTQEVVGNLDTKKYDGIIFNNIKDSWIDDEEEQDPSTIYWVAKASQMMPTTANKELKDN